MKKLSTYLFLIFFSFSAPSFADDIRDFQIEGMSIGDSLLDYFSEDEIKNNIIKDYYKYKSNKKFITVEFNELPSAKTYDLVQLDLKNDKKYEIYGLSGHIWYKENIDDCYKKQNEIDKELSKIFKGAKREHVSKKKHSVDESGKSNLTYIMYWFKSGDYASIDCTDWSSKMKPREDNLGVSFVTKEFNDWIKKD
jgi:hypothetical protein